MTEEKNIAVTATTAAAVKLKATSLRPVRCLSCVLGLRKKKLNKPQAITI